MGKHDTGTWPEDGLIFCETEQTWCCRVDMQSGRCTRNRCNIHDPEYIAHMEEVERRRIQRMHEAQEEQRKGRRV